mmetsp:Transcript_15201/g.23327  ORF Transcript_15201/g.23327 Transcript_15201/m.23327 type:complete len:646 (-) Transcript_15201:10-1947(-)
MSTITFNSYKRVAQTRTKSGNHNALGGLLDDNDPSEAKYWALHFHLGMQKHFPNQRKSHGFPKYINFEGPSKSAAIVQQVLFGPPAFGTSPPLAVVSGPRVGLYQTTGGTSHLGRALTKKKKRNGVEEEDDAVAITCDRQIGTGGNPALCGSYRNDGRLLAVGSDDGAIRVADTTSRATLSTFTSSTQLPVRAIGWLRNGKQLVAAGDDGMVRLWNLDTLEKKKATRTWTGHGDSVRCLAVWEPRRASQQRGGEKQQNNEEEKQRQIVFSGSYDHTIRMWDLALESSSSDDEEEDACLGIMNHGAPVEALLLMPNNSTEDNNNNENTNAPPCWLISAGGTELKVWNILSGTCHATIPTRHSKTITSMVCMTRVILSHDLTMEPPKTVWRIITAGLDGLMRIHTWDTSKGEIKHIHGIKLQEPITSLAFDKDTYTRLAIGTTHGNIFFRQQQPPEDIISNSHALTNKRKREPRPGTYSFFTRGQNVAASADDYAVKEESKRKRLHKFDTALRQFRYGDALDAALETRHPQVVLNMLEELGRRHKGLTIAISHRDEETLEPLLSFLVRYITRPQYASVLMGVAHQIVDVYGDDLAADSEVLSELFWKLKNQLHEELLTQQSMLRISGMVDALMTIQQQQKQQQNQVM